MAILPESDEFCTPHRITVSIPDTAAAEFQIYNPETLKIINLELIIVFLSLM